MEEIKNSLLFKFWRCFLHQFCGNNENNSIGIALSKRVSTWTLAKFFHYFSPCYLKILLKLCGHESWTQIYKSNTWCIRGEVQGWSPRTEEKFAMSYKIIEIVLGFYVKSSFQMNFKLNSKYDFFISLKTFF